MRPHGNSASIEENVKLKVSTWQKAYSQPIASFRSISEIQPILGTLLRYTLHTIGEKSCIDIRKLTPNPCINVGWGLAAGSDDIAKTLIPVKVKQSVYNFLSGLPWTRASGKSSTMLFASIICRAKIQTFHQQLQRIKIIKMFRKKKKTTLGFTIWRFNLGVKVEARRILCQFSQSNIEDEQIDSSNPEPGPFAHRRGNRRIPPANRRKSGWLITSDAANQVGRSHSTNLSVPRPLTGMSPGELRIPRHFARLP